MFEYLKMSAHWEYQGDYNTNLQGNLMKNAYLIFLIFLEMELGLAKQLKGEGKNFRNKILDKGSRKLLFCFTFQILWVKGSTNFVSILNFKLFFKFQSNYHLIPYV